MKPDNCLLHENGHVKLSDYGISVFLTDKEPMAFGRAGTPGYQGWFSF
jgi:serine/threonine protein kinase